MSRSRSRLAADWFAKLRMNATTQEVEHLEVVEASETATAIDLTPKADVTYVDTEVDALNTTVTSLATDKADASAVYTKAQVEAKIVELAPATDISMKADTTYVDSVTSSIQTQLNAKEPADATIVKDATYVKTDQNFTTAEQTKLSGIATSANNYSHPTHPGDDFSVDTGALTGATVVSDIDINVTTDSSGHVTDANGSVSTRTLTLANLGYTGATNANYITNNNQLTNGRGYITSATPPTTFNAIGTYTVASGTDSNNTRRNVGYTRSGSSIKWRIRNANGYTNVGTFTPIYPTSSQLYSTGCSGTWRAMNTTQNYHNGGNWLLEPALWVRIS